MTPPNISDAEIEAVYEALSAYSGDWYKNPSIVVRAAILASRAALLAEGKKVMAREPSQHMIDAAKAAMSPGKRPTPVFVSNSRKHKIRFRAMWDKAP